MEKETSGSHTALIVSSVALLAAAVYFLAPYFLLIPFVYAEGRGLIGPSWRGAIFRPIELLEDRFPAYGWLMGTERAFIYRHGLWPNDAVAARRAKSGFVIRHSSFGPPSQPARA